MRLWIDDLRPPPDGYEWVRTSQEAIDFLAGNDRKLELISFDHDLGGDDTSRRVVNWMIENECWADNVVVHSANPVGLDYIMGTVVRYFPNTTKVYRATYKE